MPALDRNVKVTFESCGTSVTKQHLYRHKQRCSGGKLYCTQCPNFFAKSRDDLNYHIVKQQYSQCSSTPSKTYKCKLCHAEFPGSHALCQNIQHGTKIGFGASNIDVEDIVGDVSDHCLREELQSCRHFLVDSEMQKGDIVCSILLSTTLQPYSSG